MKMSRTLVISKYCIWCGIVAVAKPGHVQACSYGQKDDTVEPLLKDISEMRTPP